LLAHKTATLDAFITSLWLTF